MCIYIYSFSPIPFEIALTLFLHFDSRPVDTSRIFPWRRPTNPQSPSPRTFKTEYLLHPPLPAIQDTNGGVIDTSHRMGTAFNFLFFLPPVFNRAFVNIERKKSCGGIFSSKGRRIVARLKNASVAWSVRVRPAISAFFLPPPREIATARFELPRELLTE